MLPPVRTGGDGRTAMVQIMVATMGTSIFMAEPYHMSRRWV